MEAGADFLATLLICVTQQIIKNHQKSSNITIIFSIFTFCPTEKWHRLKIGWPGLALRFEAGWW